MVQHMPSLADDGLLKWYKQNSEINRVFLLEPQRARAVQGISRADNCLARCFHPSNAVFWSQICKMEISQRLHTLQEVLSEPTKGWTVLNSNPFHTKISPFLSLIVVFLILCLVTRVITGLRASLLQMNTNAQQKTVTRVPYWVPFLGSALSLIRDTDGTVAKGRFVKRSSQFTRHILIWT